jgi:hypothetical protein
LLDRLAWTSHRLFYPAVTIMAGSGLALAVQAGLPAIVFGGQGTLPADFWVYPIAHRPLPHVTRVDRFDRPSRRRRSLPHLHPQGSTVAPDGFRQPHSGERGCRPAKSPTANPTGAPMNYLVPAQAGAQLLSLFIFATMARWYVAPRLAKLGRADALVLLLWMHAFRYIALQAFSAQRDGFPISDSALMEIVLGDLGGAVIALAAIFALRHRMRIGIALSWVLVAETLFDTVSNIHGGMREHLFGAAGGVTWLILAFYVPLVIVSLVLLAWQLYARRGEELASADQFRNPSFAPL